MSTSLAIKEREFTEQLKMHDKTSTAALTEVVGEAHSLTDLKLVATEASKHAKKQ